MANIFASLLQRGANAGMIPNRTSEARQWYRNVASGAKVKSQELVLSNATSETNSQKIVVGKMLMFQYQPTTIDKLPYWDKFPLVFPFHFDSTGFYGINMHYLPLDLRAKLMDSLYDLVNNKRYDDSTRLKMSYDILNSAAQFRFFKPCVKHYLNKGLRSRLITIPTEQWDIALFLPMERFQQGKSKPVSQFAVQGDSRRTIRGR